MIKDPVKTFPEKIYLQTTGEYALEPFDRRLMKETTWCEDKIYDSDVEYIRADHAREMSIWFKKWCDKNIAMKNKDGEFIVTTFSGLDYNKTYTLDHLYTKYLETLNKEK